MNRADFIGLVRGFVWKCRMFNGAIFEWWTPEDVSRAEARKQLFSIANMFCSEDDLAYEKGDMESLWKTKG